MVLTTDKAITNKWIIWNFFITILWLITTDNQTESDNNKMHPNLLQRSDYCYEILSDSSYSTQSPLDSWNLELIISAWTTEVTPGSVFLSDIVSTGKMTVVELIYKHIFICFWLPGTSSGCLQINRDSDNTAIHLGLPPWLSCHPGQHSL